MGSGRNSTICVNESEKKLLGIFGYFVIVNAGDREEFANRLKRFGERHVLTRMISYDPPEGYVSLWERGEKDV